MNGKMDIIRPVANSIRNRQVIDRRALFSQFISYDQKLIEGGRSVEQLTISAAPADYNLSSKL